MNCLYRHDTCVITEIVGTLSIFLALFGGKIREVSLFVISNSATDTCEKSLHFYNRFYSIYKTLFYRLCTPKTIYLVWKFVFNR